MIRRPSLRVQSKVIGAARTFYSTPAPYALLREQNEKATRQQGGLFFSRENSSNGGKAVKTFWIKSYEPKKEGVKQFLGNKCLWFQ
jgi:hypothetical protein